MRRLMAVVMALMLVAQQAFGVNEWLQTDVIVNDATTNNISTVLTLRHTTTGTAAAGIGPSLLFQGENGSGTTVLAGTLNCTLTDVTAGSVDGKFTLRLPVNSTDTALLDISAAASTLTLTPASGITTVNVLNTVATTVNAFGASTATTEGATTGTHTIRNATVALSGATAFTVAAPTTLSGTVAVTGNTTLTGTSAAVLVIGSDASGNRTPQLKTDSGYWKALEFYSAGTAKWNVGSENGADAFQLAPGAIGTSAILSVGQASGDFVFGRGITLTGSDLAINATTPDITTTATGTGSIFNTNLLTLNIGGAATAMTFGATTGTMTLRNATVALSGGTLNVGADDTTQGIENIYGGSAAQGGVVRTYIGADNDATLQYWAIGNVGGTGNYALSNSALNVIYTVEDTTLNMLMTSKLKHRSVTDAGPMTATGGLQGEIAFNTSNSIFYGCTVTHATAATWAALH